MRPDQLKDLEIKLREACQKAVARGITLKPGSFGVDVFNWGTVDNLWCAVTKCCCPMGAFLEGKRASGGSPGWDAAHALGISVEEVGAFTAGFDAIQDPGWSKWGSLYELGQKLRQELCPQETPSSSAL